MKYLEILFNKIIIKYIKWRYNPRCKEEDFVEECIDCKAGRAIKFIKENIELIKI